MILTSQNAMAENIKKNNLEIKLILPEYLNDAMHTTF